MRRPESLLCAALALTPITACRGPAPRFPLPSLPRNQGRAARGFARYIGGRATDEAAPGDFQTCVRRYCRGDGEIILAGLIRFARPAYYQALRQELTPYQRLLQIDVRGAFGRRGGPKTPPGLQALSGALLMDAGRPPALRSLPQLRAFLEQNRAQNRLFPPSPPLSAELRRRLHRAALALTEPPDSRAAPAELRALDPEAFGPPIAPDRASLDAVQAALNKADSRPVVVILGLARAGPLDRWIREELGFGPYHETWIKAWSSRVFEAPESFEPLPRAEPPPQPRASQYPPRTSTGPRPPEKTPAKEER